MSRPIRRGALALLALSLGMAWIVPATRAQVAAGRDRDRDRIASASGKARALRQQGKLAEAKRELEQALEFARGAIGPESPTAASLLNDLALLDRDLGRFDEAEGRFLRSLEIRRKQLG